MKTYLKPSVGNQIIAKLNSDGQYYNVVKLGIVVGKLDGYGYYPHGNMTVALSPENLNEIIDICEQFENLDNS